jgi:hypothetical protein
MTSDSVDRLPDCDGTDHVPVAQLARQQGVGPVASIDDLARPELFEFDEEPADFLVDLYAARHAGMA